jgi:iron complex outermembrane receptor protein
MMCVINRLAAAGAFAGSLCVSGALFAFDDLSLPVALSSSRLNFHSEWEPQPVTKITEEMIRNSGARTIADVLRLVPGMTVGYKYGNQPTIITRGLTHEQNKRIEIKIDGQSVYLPATGGSFLANLPVQLSDVRSIEVQTGPSSAWNGSNALISTIHIFTKSGEISPAFETFIQHGGNGVDDKYVSGSIVVNDYWTSRISVKEYQDEGLERRFDDRQDRSIWSRNDIMLDDNQILQVNFGLSDSHYLAGGTDPQSDPLRDLDQSRKLLFIEHSKIFSPAYDMRTKIKYDSFDLEHPLRAFNPLLGPYSIDYSYKTEQYGIEHFHSLEVDEFQIVLGLAGYRSAYESEGRINNHFNNRVENTDYQTFSQIAWTHNQHHMTHFGMMVEKTDLIDETNFSYQLSHIYSPVDNHYLRAGYSTGYRRPSGFEFAGTNKIDIDALPYPVYTLISSGYQNNALDHEKIEETSFGYTYKNDERGITFNSLVYYSSIDNYIEFTERLEPSQAATPFAMVADYVNHEKPVVLKGIENSITYKPSHNLFIKGSYTYSEVDGNLDSGFDLSQTHPKELVSLYTYYMPDPNWTYSITYDRVSQSSWSPSEVTDGFEKLDAMARYCHDRGRDSMCISLHGNNLLGDVSDARNEYYWSRNAFLRFEYVFR